MMKFFVILAVLFVCSSFSLVNGQSGCWACAGQIAAVGESSSPTNPPQPAVKYVPGWADFGDGGKGCYWCADPYVWGQTCVPLARSKQAGCSATAECSIEDVWGSKMLASPFGSINSAACKLVAPKWFYYNVTSWNLFKCGCSNSYVGREGPNYVAKKVSLTPDEFKVLSEKYPLTDEEAEAAEKPEVAEAIESRQNNSWMWQPNCYHSRLCDPNYRSDCSDAQNCPNSTVIPCTSIAGSNSSCPGYFASPYGTTSCPMKEGPPCGLCNGAPGNVGMCSGNLNNFTQCPGTGLCLECHVIKLQNGNSICGAHLARSQSQCFCAPQQYYGVGSNRWQIMCGGYGSSYRGEGSHQVRSLSSTMSSVSGSSASTTSTSMNATSWSASSSTTATSTTGMNATTTGSGSTASSTTGGNGSTTGNSTTTSTTGIEITYGPDVVEGPWMCAPWGQDIITMHCVVGNGYSGTVATVADCDAGRAIVPTACPDTYHCGGHLCAHIAGTGYQHWPIWQDLYPTL